MYLARHTVSVFTNWARESSDAGLAKRPAVTIPRAAVERVARAALRRRQPARQPPLVLLGGENRSYLPFLQRPRALYGRARHHRLLAVPDHVGEALPAERVYTFAQHSARARGAALDTNAALKFFSIRHKRLLLQFH